MVDVLDKEPGTETIVGQGKSSAFQRLLVSLKEWRCRWCRLPSKEGVAIGRVGATLREPEPERGGCTVQGRLDDGRELVVALREVVCLTEEESAVESPCSEELLQDGFGFQQEGNGVFVRWCVRRQMYEGMDLVATHAGSKERSLHFDM